MDRKSVIILVVSFVLLIFWYPLINKLYPPVPGSQTNLVASGSTAASNNTSTALSVQPATATQPAGMTPQLNAPVAGVPIRPAAPERIEILETAKVRYHFTSHGGGLKLIELKDFPALVACNRKDKALTNSLASLNTDAPTSVFQFLGGEALEGDGNYQLTQANGVMRAEKALPNGLAIVKEFKPGSNYMVQVSVRLENRSNSEIRLPVQELIIGTATPVNSHDDAMMMGLQWYHGDHVERIGSAWFENRTLGCATSAPRLTYESSGATNISWAAIHNQFFTVAAMPKEPASQVVSRRVDLPPPTAAELEIDPKAVRRPFGFQTAFLYSGAVLAPKQTVEKNYSVYAGPKKYNTLAQIGSEFGNNLDLIMEYNGFFGWFAKALLLSMNGLHALSLPYAGAIIVITVIIKLVFWPLTQASTRSMKRMATLQPQMKAIQDKYKDDPKKMNQKLMEFMKENKVNPVGGCLPMLIQIPVFFGFFTMLRSAVELRGASFLWACDLSQPDTLFIIPGLNLPFNLLPIIMTGTTLWQTHLTPPSPGMDPVQQKIMKYMPLMFIVILYNFSSGLTLYWTVQNLLSILQMKLTKDEKPAAPAAPVARAKR